MINEEKVKNMTRAAAYEKGEGKKNIEISHYFKNDYVGLQLIKSAVAYAAVFAMLTGLWILSQGEAIMLKLTHANYMQGLLKLLIILFVAGLVVYETAVSIYYSRRHAQAAESVGEFSSRLKTIHQFYETEESEADECEIIELSDKENTL